MQGRLVRWLVIGPLAAGGLVAILIGGPVLLLELGGNPLPGRIPGPGEMVDALTRPDDGRLLLWALTVVGWIAWVTVAGSILLELGAQLTGHRTPRVPGLAGPQRLAGLLVAGVLAALTSPGIGHAQAQYVHATVAEAAPSTPPPGSPMPAPTGIGEPATTEQRQDPLVHEVASGDWMWFIAKRYLGDAERYPEIAALNPELAREHPDYPDHIEPGDRLVLPADAHDRGERRHATGDLIGEQAEPGQEAPPAEEPPAPEPPPEQPAPAPPPPMPAPDATQSPSTPPPTPPATPPQTAPPETAPPETAPPETAPPESAPATAPPETPPQTAPPESAPATAPPESPPATAPPETPPQTAPAMPPQQAGGRPEQPAGQEPAGEPRPDEASAENPEAEQDSPAPLYATGVLASVLVGTLALYRWRKLARRRHRRTITAPVDAAAETGLQEAADADVTRLDTALRFLADAHAVPDIGAVWIGEGEIHLILASPTHLDPPAPFHAGPGTWFLPVSAELPLVTGAMAPLPALATVGSRPGAYLLVDLERMGLLTINGNPERAADLLRYLVAELAHNPWSDRVEITLAGFAPEAAAALAALRPDRIAVEDSIPDAVARLRQRLAHTTAALTAHGLTDATHGRVGDIATDTWIPHLLLVNRPEPEHDQLLAELESELEVPGATRCAVAVVTTAAAGGPYGRHTLSITDDGMLKAGFLDDSQRLPAASLPEHLLGPLARLLWDAAEGPDHPIPPAAEAWAAGTDATGGVVTHDTSRTIELPLFPLAPSAYEDPGLDEAVAEWFMDGEVPPRLALLGPIRLGAPGSPPEHRARICLELIVYLAACGEAGADAAEISRRLWPNQPPNPAVRTNVITGARRWLGDRPDGEPWLSEADSDGRYRLREGILVDWHLFRRLRTRGERRGLDGAADLRTALRLVRGLPLVDAAALAGTGGRLPYSWLPGSLVEPGLVLAGVIDTAHQLVEVSLAVGDPGAARWAVQQAWLADPRRGDDHPWRDLLRIAHAEGDRDQVREIVADLLAWRDAEHPEELNPDTRRLIESLLPSHAMS